MKFTVPKFIVTCLAAASTLAGCNAHAQTTNPPAFPPAYNGFDAATNLLANSGLSTGTVSTIGAGLNLLLDTHPYVTNGFALYEVGALKVGSSYGAYADIQFPLNTNSWQMTAGTAIGYISNQVYSATLNVTIGTQVSLPGAVNIPIIGKYVQPFYMFAESGPGYNFMSHQVVAQYFAGIKYIQPIGKWGIGGSYGIGGLSDVGQKLQEFSLIVTR